MRELKVHVPTYLGGSDVVGAEKPEFGEPMVPVVAREADGIRIVLGSHDYWGSNCPDIQVERRISGWLIFVQPEAGADTSGYLCIMDDGRSFVVHAGHHGDPGPIQTRSYSEAIDELDHPSKKHEADAVSDHLEQCEFCEDKLDPSDGDNWDGLCPECADFVSTFLDRMRMNECDRDEALIILKNHRRP